MDTHSFGNGKRGHPQFLACEKHGHPLTGTRGKQEEVGVQEFPQTGRTRSRRQIRSAKSRIGGQIRAVGRMKGEESDRGGRRRAWSCKAKDYERGKVQAGSRGGSEKAIRAAEKPASQRLPS